MDIEEEYGVDYEPGLLADILIKDRKFWGSDGGVTFSGGEALLQAEQLEEVWQRLKSGGIHLALETALFVPQILLETAMKYMDFYYVDVKLLERESCARILGGDVNQYRQNVEKLAAQGKDICFRVPCSKEYVLAEDNRRMLCEFLRSYRQFPVEIFAVHDLGKEKYRSLGMEMPCFERVSEEEMEAFRERLCQNGCRARIIRI